MSNFIHTLLGTWVLIHAGICSSVLAGTYKTHGCYKFLVLVKRVSRFWELMFTTQGQVIIWNNVGILLIGPLGTIQWNFNLNLYVFIQEDAFENAGCEMAAILSRSECHGVKVDLQFSCTRIITIRPPFSDDIFKSIILNTNLFLNVQLTMSQLVQIVSWRWRGDKPLPEPMLTKIYDGIWRQWVS